MNDTLTVWLDDRLASSDGLGGKGASLIELSRAGFNVPAGFVLTADAYAAFVDANQLRPAIEALLDTPDLRVPKVAREATAALSRQIETALLPDAIRSAVSDDYATLQRHAAGPVAARSSALSEDAGGASSAGLYDTFLNLGGLEAVLDAVHRCYASLWTQRAVQYRAFKGLDGRREAMAVVMMAQVPAAVAGVAFTANPLTRDRGQIVVNASWGLGEAVVSGRVTPDSFVLDAADLTVLDRQIAEKSIEVVADPGGGSGTVERGVAAARATAPALDDAHLRRLGETCRSIERHYGRPMDIEWAFAGDELFILQARPITTLS